MSKTMVFVSPCTPDIKGVGWEQRAFSFLLSYSKLYRIILWFQPTQDDRNLRRLRGCLDLIDAAYSFDERFLPHDPGLVSQLTGTLKSAHLVHVFRLERFLEQLQHPKILWDFDELPYPLRAPNRQLGSPAPSLEVVSELYRRYEVCWKKAKVVMASSSEEHHPLLGRPLVVPNVAHLGNKREVIDDTKEILFVGNLNKHENLSGLKFFIDKCLPKLPPDVRLSIVGRSPKSIKSIEFMRSVSNRPNTKVFYDVENCEPFYRRAQVVIVPLQQGAGTKLKLLEALAHHCPVVTTTKGIEGLDVVDGRDVLIRDNPEEFTAACKLLLDNQKMSMRIATNGYSLVEKMYSQRHVDSLLRDLLVSQ